MRFKSCGVTCSPDIVHHALRTPPDRFIILASDGLWKVLDNQSAIDFVQRTLAREHAADPAGAMLNNAQAAAHALVQEALRLGSQDNVTVIVIVF